MATCGWFQIHLSTAFMLMLTIGGLGYLQSRMTIDEAIPLVGMQDCDGSLKEKFGTRDDIWGVYYGYGWPRSTVRHFQYVAAEHFLPDQTIEQHHIDGIRMGLPQTKLITLKIDKLAFVFDLVLSVLTLFLAGMTTELIARQKLAPLRSSTPAPIDS